MGFSIPKPNKQLLVYCLQAPSHFLFHKSLNQKLVFSLDIFYNVALKSRFPTADRIITYQITQTIHIYQKAVSEGEEQKDTKAPSDGGSELLTAPPGRENKPAQCIDKHSTIYVL